MNSLTLGFHIQLEYDIYVEIMKIDSCLFCFYQLDSQPALPMPQSFRFKFGHLYYHPKLNA